MTVNRMGSARRNSNRKAWIAGTLTLGALAATGGVATAAFAHEHSREHRSSPVGHTSSSKTSYGGSERDEDMGKNESKDEGKNESEGSANSGQVCLRLDRNAQKAIAAAEKAAKGAKTVDVPLSKVEVLPCEASQPGNPAPAPQPPAPPAPAPQPTTTSAPPAPAPAPPPAPAPAPNPPKPTVTSSAS